MRDVCFLRGLRLTSTVSRWECGLMTLVIALKGFGRCVRAWLTGSGFNFYTTQGGMEEDVATLLQRRFRSPGAV